MIKTTLTLIIGGLLAGIIGSHLFSFHAIGFILGVMAFVIAYCCLTLDPEPERSNLP
jgi:hypothetical protein